MKNALKALAKSALIALEIAASAADSVIHKKILRSRMHLTDLANMTNRFKQING